MNPIKFDWSLGEDVPQSGFDWSLGEDASKEEEKPFFQRLQEDPFNTLKDAYLYNPASATLGKIATGTLSNLSASVAASLKDTTLDIGDPLGVTGTLGRAIEVTTGFDVPSLEVTNPVSMMPGYSALSSYADSVRQKMADWKSFWTEKAPDQGNLKEVMEKKLSMQDTALELLKEPLGNAYDLGVEAASFLLPLAASRGAGLGTSPPVLVVNSVAQNYGTNVEASVAAGKDWETATKDGAIKTAFDVVGDLTGYALGAMDVKLWAGKAQDLALKTTADAIASTGTTAFGHSLVGESKSAAELMVTFGMSLATGVPEVMLGSLESKVDYSNDSTLLPREVFEPSTQEKTIISLRIYQKLQEARAENLAKLPEATKLVEERTGVPLNDVFRDLGTNSTFALDTGAGAPSDMSIKALIAGKHVSVGGMYDSEASFKAYVEPTLQKLTHKLQNNRSRPFTFSTEELGNITSAKDLPKGEYLSLDISSFTKDIGNAELDLLKAQERLDQAKVQLENKEDGVDENAVKFFEEEVRKKEGELKMAVKVKNTFTRMAHLQFKAIANYVKKVSPEYSLVVTNQPWERNAYGSALTFTGPKLITINLDFATMFGADFGTSSATGKPSVKLNQEKMFFGNEVAAHEVAHGLIASKIRELKKTAPETLNALHQSYLGLMQQVQVMPLRQAFHALYPPHLAETLLKRFSKDADIDAVPFSELHLLSDTDYRDYNLSFSEYAANQLAKVLADPEFVKANPHLAPLKGFKLDVAKVYDQSIWGTDKAPEILLAESAFPAALRREIKAMEIGERNWQVPYPKPFKGKQFESIAYIPFREEVPVAELQKVAQDPRTSDLEKRVWKDVLSTLNIRQLADGTVPWQKIVENISPAFEYEVRRDAQVKSMGVIQKIFDDAFTTVRTNETLVNTKQKLVDAINATALGGWITQRAKEAKDRYDSRMAFAQDKVKGIFQGVKERSWNNNSPPEVHLYSKTNQIAHGIRMGKINEALQQIEKWNKIGTKSARQYGEIVNAISLGMFDKQYYDTEAQLIRQKAREQGLPENSETVQKAIMRIPKPHYSQLLKYIDIPRELGPTAEVHKTIGEIFGAYEKHIEDLKKLRLSFVDKDLFEGKITPEEHGKKTASINQTFSQRLINYVPMKRYGKHVAKVVATEDMELEGLSFKKGETILRRQFTSMKDRDAFLRDAMSFRPNSTKIEKFTEHYTDHPGTPELPANLVEELKDDILASVPEEKRAEFEKKFADFHREHAVARAFDKHLISRNGVLGAETDFRKVYASYSESYANMYASVAMARDFNQIFTSLHSRIKQLESIADERTAEGREARKEMEALKYDLRFMQEHRNMLYTGEGRVISAVKSAAFYWQFAADLTAAAVETLQVPTVAFPFLSERFGHVNSFTALAKAANDIVNWATTGRGISAEEVSLIETLMKEGTLDQGSTTDIVEQGLRGYSTNPGIQFLKEKAGKALEFSTKPLRLASKGSREAVALAGYRLAKQKYPNLSQKELLNASRFVVDSSMFDASSANKAWILKNWQGVLTLFQGYTFRMANFGLQNKKAGMKYMALMLPLVGVGGLPMAEDTMDVIDAAGQMAKKLSGEVGVVDSRLALREMFEEMNQDPDLMMHGLSRTGFGIGEFYSLFAEGPKPELDVSGRLSMGRMIPMGLTRLLSSMASGTKDPDTLLANTMQGGSGYYGTVLANGFSYLFSDSKGSWKEMEKVMPRGARNLSTALRYAIQNKEVDYNNITTAEFDPENPADLIHIAGTLLGMRPTKLSQKIEADITKRRHYNIWETQRAALMVKYKTYFLEENEEMRDKTLDDIRDFNSKAPPGFQITKIVEALKADLRRRKMIEMGMIRGDSKSASFRDFDRLFYREEEDDKIPESQVKTTF